MKTILLILGAFILQVSTAFASNDTCSAKAAMAALAIGKIETSDSSTRLGGDPYVYDYTVKMSADCTSIKSVELSSIDGQAVQ